MVTQAVGLLALPREIRDEIYRHLISGDARVINPSNGQTLSSEEGSIREIRLTGGDNSIQLCCRQIRIEYRETFYKKAVLGVSARVFGPESNLFFEIKRYLPDTIRQEVHNCTVQVAWKPDHRNAHYKPVPALIHNLTELCRLLPSLQAITLEFRYFDVHDLEDDICKKDFVLADFYQIPHELPVAKTELRLTATTSLCTQGGNHGLEGPNDPLQLAEYHLATGTFVIWRFSPCPETHAWHGLMPEVNSFFSYGEEAKTMEQLREVVLKKHLENQALSSILF